MTCKYSLWGAAAIIVLCLSVSFASPRWIVGRVGFTGNESVSRHDLLSVMALRPPFLLNRTPYDLSVLFTDINSITALYGSRGFREADIRIKSVERDSTAGFVSIVISIREGPRTIINTVTLNGDTSLPEVRRVEGKLPVKPGLPLDSTLIDAARREITESMNSSGRLFSSVTAVTNVDTSGHRAALSYEINGGPIVRAGGIEAVGFKKTKPVVARRELEFKYGDTLTVNKIRLSARRLYGLDLYTMVNIEPVDTFATAVRTDTGIVAPVVVQVTESDMLAFRANGGYGQYVGWYLDGQVAYKSLFGLGHRIDVTGLYSSVERSAEIHYLYPYVAGIPVQAELSVYFDSRDAIDYSGFFDGLLAGAGTTIGKALYTKGWLRFERTENLEQPAPSGNFVTVPKKPSAVLAGSTIYDSRNWEKPHLAGVYTGLEGQLGGLIPSSYHFVKGIADIRGYFGPFTRYLSFGSALQVASVAGYGPDRESVPPQERFLIGNGVIRPVRGYSTKEVSPVDPAGQVRSGRFALVVNIIEMRFTIGRYLELIAFTDAGNVWNAPSDFTLNGLHISAGPGIGIKTPVGLFGIDYGFKINSRGGPPGAVSLSAGRTF